MTAQAGKSPASWLAEGRASPSLRAEKGATKAGWRKYRGKIVFPPRLFISQVKFVQEMGLWKPMGSC